MAYPQHLHAANSNNATATDKPPTTMPPPSSLRQNNNTHRSFTLPAKLTARDPPTTAPTVEIGASAAIETLFVHPAARVISFTAVAFTLTTTTSTSRPSTSSGVRQSWFTNTSFPHSQKLRQSDRVQTPLDLQPQQHESPRQEETSSSLPWSNAAERTIAAGPLEIYRVPGSVSFLHSGTLLHPILRRSQCWCVDDVSTFALRVRNDTYYRIELPCETQEEKELVEGLKTTLGEILFYERTVCPFRRGIGDGNGVEVVDVEGWPRRGGSRGGRNAGAAVKKWTFDREWRPEGTEEERSDEEETRAELEERRLLREEEKEDGDLGDDDDSDAVIRARAARSVTAPALLGLGIVRTPSKTKVPQIAERIDEAVRSQAKSARSTPVRMRSVTELPTPRLPPTPESIRDMPSVSTPQKEPDLDPASDEEVNHDDTREDRQEGGSPDPTGEEIYTHDLHSDRNNDQLDQRDPPPLLAFTSPPHSTIAQSVQTSNPTPTPQAFSTSSNPSPTPSSTSTSSTLDSWTTLPTPTPSSPTLLSTRKPSFKTPPPKDNSPLLLRPPSPLLPPSSSPPLQTQPQPTTAAGGEERNPTLASLTLHLFLGPPAHLVNAMLRMAARFILFALDGPAFHSVSAAAASSSSSIEFSSRVHRATVDVVDDDDDDDDESFHRKRGRGVGCASGVSVDGGRQSATATATTTTTTTGVQTRRQRSPWSTIYGHKRVPGSFDFSDDDDDG